MRMASSTEMMAPRGNAEDVNAQRVSPERLERKVVRSHTSFAQLGIAVQYSRVVGYMLGIVVIVYSAGVTTGVLAGAVWVVLQIF